MSLSNDDNYPKLDLYIYIYCCCCERAPSLASYCTHINGSTWYEMCCSLGKGFDQTEVVLYIFIFNLEWERGER